MNNNIIVGISGASGAIYAVKLLEALQKLKLVIHLVISSAAHKTIEYETKYTLDEVKSIADHIYDNHNFASTISSGSFKTLGMIIAPCSVKTMAQIATGNIDSLIARSADVCLKERRKLVLMVRESPLHLGHLRNMATLSEMGAIIAPPLPAMYILPKTIDDIINHTIGKIIDLFNIENNLVKRWSGVD